MEMVMRAVHLNLGYMHRIDEVTALGQRRRS